MSKNNQGLKLQKSTEKVHYRMFKSGKVWLFAAVATFTVATGATVTANADTVDDTAASTTAVVTSSATSATPAADSTVTSSAATSANSVVLGSQAPSDVTTTPASSADSSSASLAGTNIADSDYATSSQSVIAGSVFQNSDTQTDTNSAVESDAADTHNKVITDNGQGETAADALPGGEGNTVPTSTDVNLVVTGSSLVSASFLGDQGQYVVIKVPAGLTVTTQTDADGNVVMASGTSNLTFNVGDVDALNQLNQFLETLTTQLGAAADQITDWLGFKNDYEQAISDLDISGLLAQLGQSNFTAPIQIKTLADGTQEILVDISGQSAYKQISDTINRIIDQVQKGIGELNLTGTNPISSIIASIVNPIAGDGEAVLNTILDSLQAFGNSIADGATTGLLQLPNFGIDGSTVVTVSVSVTTPALADVTDTSAQQFEFTGDIVDSNVIDLNAFDSGASVGSLYYKKAPSVEAGKVLGTSTTGYSVELTGTPNATVAIYNAAGQQVGQTTLNASGLGTATLTGVSADDELYAVPYIEQASGDTIYGNVLVGDALVDPDSNNAAFQNDNVIGSSATFTVPADETTEPGDGGDNGNGGDNNGSGDNNNNGGSNTGDNGSNTGDNGSTGNNGANTGSDNGSGSLVNGTGSVNNTAATTDNGAKVAQLSTTPNTTATTASKSASEKLPQTSEANNDLAAMGMVALVASMFGLGALGLRKREDNM